MKESEMTLRQIVDKIEKINKNMEELHIYKKFCLHLGEEYSLSSYYIRNKTDMKNVLEKFVSEVELALKNHFWKYNDDYNRYELTFTTRYNYDCCDRQYDETRNYYIYIAEDDSSIMWKMR